jgi:hypothetical protein
MSWPPSRGSNPRLAADRREATPTPPTVARSRRISAELAAEDGLAAILSGTPLTLTALAGTDHGRRGAA